MLQAQDLAYGGAGAGSHAAFFYGLVGSCRGGRFAHRYGGTHTVSDEGKIENDSGGNQRHFARASFETEALTRQIAAHAGGRLQPEGTAAGEENAMHFVGEVPRIEDGRFLGAAGGSADIDSAHCALRTENRGTAGDRLKI